MTPEEKQILETLNKKIDNLSGKLTALLTEKKKQTWVGVHAIKMVTGWSGKEMLRTMREDGCVVYDKEKGYLLESIPEVFIKKTA